MIIKKCQPIEGDVEIFLKERLNFNVVEFIIKSYAISEIVDNDIILTIEKIPDSLIETNFSINLWSFIFQNNLMPLNSWYETNEFTLKPWESWIEHRRKLNPLLRNPDNQISWVTLHLIELDKWRYDEICSNLGMYLFPIEADKLLKDFGFEIKFIKV